MIVECMRHSLRPDPARITDLLLSDQIWLWETYVGRACVVGLGGQECQGQFLGTQGGKKVHSTRTVADLRLYQVMSSTAIIFPFTVFFAKVSILLIYLRLFKIDRPLRISIHVGLILMALFHAAIIGVGIGTVIKCVGVSASTSTFCNAASGSIQLAQSAFNVVTDFWILILPMPLVRKLQLPRSRKIGLFFVFGAGVLYACVLAP